MTVQSSLFTTLGGNAALTAAVGVRIYPDVAPIGVAVPYVVWSEVGTTPYNSMAGHDGLTQYRIQIMSFASSALRAREVAQLVRTAMAAATEFKSLEIDSASGDFEDGSKVYGMRSDFSVWYRGQ